MKEHRAKLDARLAAHGRTPRDVGCLWSIRIQIGESEADALAIERRYIESIPPQAGLIELSHMFGLDFSKFRNDMKVSDVAESVKSENVHWGSFQEILDTTDPDMTIGELGRKHAIGKSLVARGTPKMIADQLEEMHHETGANGGFILAKGLSVPGYLRNFVEYVVPELQRRGLTKTKYEGRTLRENLN
jgi:alkanesulfonate monooxygenase SsuD/methylene tetrahydromethanopterin reductase-like flavin-dependent oxidoreductase (luciferase family)